MNKGKSLTWTELEGVITEWFVGYDNDVNQMLWSSQSPHPEHVQPPS